MEDFLKTADWLFAKYNNEMSVNLSYYLSKLRKVSISKDYFTFYNAVSSMASSKIEGESLEIDSYVKHKIYGTRYNKALTEKPNDLYNAYEFAQQNTLTKTNFFKVHKLATKNLLHTSARGKVRVYDMVIRENSKVVYEAVSKENVQKEFDLFFQWVLKLLKEKHTQKEIFFYASFVHLLFVKMHPFEDGNGRTARLLEKWFLAEKLGEIGWFVQSELYYWNNRNEYYKNLGKLGLFYEKLDFKKSISFLKMLPSSLK